MKPFCVWSEMLIFIFKKLKTTLSPHIMWFRMNMLLLFSLGPAQHARTDSAENRSPAPPAPLRRIVCAQPFVL